MSLLSDKFARMLGLRNAYRRAFLGPTGEPNQALRIVLLDLERFCRVRTSTVVVSPISRQIDTHATMVAEGRREVFNRLTYYLNLTDDQLNALQDTNDETQAR